MRTKKIYSFTLPISEAEELKRKCEIAHVKFSRIVQYMVIRLLRYTIEDLQFVDDFLKEYYGENK